VGQPDGLIAQINRAPFPVPASSAEGAEERLDRQNPVVERVAIIRNAKNEGIDISTVSADRSDRSANRMVRQRWDGWLSKPPKDHVMVCRGRPRSCGAAVTPLDTRPAQTTSLARLFSVLALAVVGEASKASTAMAAVAHPGSREEQP
jgi:hypothetical protein